MKILPSEKIEPIIFKLICTKSKYVNALMELYESKWFDNKYLGALAEMVFKYYRKHNKIPTKETLDLITNHLYKEDKDLKPCCEIIEKSLNIDLSQYEEAFLDENVMNYIRNSAYFYTVSKNIDDIQKTHNASSLVDSLQKISSISFDTNLGLDYIEDIDEHLNNLVLSKNRMSTGYRILDEVTNGGWIKDAKCLAVFAAGTHVGKSQMLTNTIARQLEMGRFMVLYTMEMSQDIYAQRVSANLTSIDINAIPDNTAKVKSYITNLKNAHPDAKCVYKEFPASEVNCLNFKDHIERCIFKYGRKPDIIVVDYLTLIKPNHHNGGDNSYAMYTRVSEELRNLSAYFKIPVITAAQLNRDGNSSTVPEIKQLADSMGIAKTADFIAGLWLNDGDREAGLFNMNILKNRLGGKIGTRIQFNVNYNNLTIGEFKKVDQKEIDDNVSMLEKIKKDKEESAAEVIESD